MSTLVVDSSLAAAPAVSQSPVAVAPLSSSNSNSKTNTTSITTTTTTTTTTSSNNVSYHQEITQMIYVFTQLKLPNSNQQQLVVQLIQDLVRQELIQLVLKAKLQSTITNQQQQQQTTGGGGGKPQSQSQFQKESSLSSQGNVTSNASIGVEDLLFVIRKDVSKVERLKLYLSWKDVRKKTRAEPSSTGGGGTDGGGGEDVVVDNIDGIEDSPDKNLKVGKSRINLSWESLGDPWNEYLLGNSSTSSPLSRTTTTTSDQGGEDDVSTRGLSVQEKRAYSINREILREANEMTEKMTREEYEQYSTARQASFVYRKSKKFRDFLLIDLATSLSDELLDILGFLGYEIVRTLCKAGLNQARLRLLYQQQTISDDEKKKSRKKRKFNQDQEGGEGEEGCEEKGINVLDPNSKDYPSVLRPVPTTISSSKKGKKLEPIVSLFSAPIETNNLDQLEGEQDTGRVDKVGENNEKTNKSEIKNVVVKTLEMKDLLNGFYNETHHLHGSNGGLENGNDKVGMGKGLRNWRGGLGAVRGRGGNTLF